MRLKLSLATANDSRLLGDHAADDLECLSLHLHGLKLLLLGLLSQLLSLLSCQHFGLCLSLGLEELLLLDLVGLSERVNEPDGQVIVPGHLFLLLLLLERLPPLLFTFLGELARAKHIDRHPVKLADSFFFSCFSFFFSCFLGSESLFFCFDLRCNFSLKNFLGLNNEVWKLDFDDWSHNQLIFVLNIVSVPILVPLTLRDEAFWHVIDTCVDLFDSEFFHLLKLFCTTDATAERESTAFLVIQRFRGRWVRNTKRAVNAIAVLGRRRIRIASVDNVVAWSAEVIGAPAAESGDRAAVHALPINEFNAVLLAFSHADSHLI